MPYCEVMISVGINGLGRIGRLAFRAILLRHAGELRIAAINTSGSMNVSGWAHLIKYDTTYRKFEIDVGVEETQNAKDATDENPLIGYLVVNAEKTPVYAQRAPEKIPWGEHDIDVVIESTGVFTTEEGAKKHATAGAKRVVISAPSKGGNVGTYVLGVNEYKGEGTVVSNASCTTNCIAPVAAVLHAKFGIVKAAMTTVHGFTDDQRLQDNSHKDLRRARAAGANIVPTSTGAAIATTETIPELKGLFDGTALRVPIQTGSITDFTLLLSRRVTVEEVNAAFQEAESNPIYKGILTTTDAPLVSSDIIGRTESSIVDLGLTKVIDGDLVKVFAWYDNEWGYTNRLVEQVLRVGRTVSSGTAPSDPITTTFAHGS